MNSPERVYALLVEANPIQDPQAVPPILSPVLLDERRSEMLKQDKQEPTETNQITRRPHWSRAVVGFAATIVIVGAAIGVWSISNNDRSVAAGEARLEVTFTGEAASFVGDQRIAEGSANVTFINETTERVAFVIQRFDTGSDELAAELAAIPLGGNAPPPDVVPPGRVLLLYVGPGSSTARTIELKPGTHLFDAGTLQDESNYAEHIWRTDVSVAVVAG